MVTENVYVAVSKDCPERPLLDPEGSLSSKVPSSSIWMKVLEQFRISHRSMNNKCN